MLPITGRPWKGDFQRIRNQLTKRNQPEENQMGIRRIMEARTMAVAMPPASYRPGKRPLDDTLQLLRKEGEPDYSRLFSIEPCGVKTGYVESITSYLVRLSDVHGLTPSGLVVREFAPLFHRRPVDHRGHCDLFGSFGASLNGIGRTALEGVKILEHLTARNNLGALTLL